MPTGTVSYGYPKLLFQMRIEYQDGTSAEVVSDESLEADHRGPDPRPTTNTTARSMTRAGNARLERAGF